MQGQIRFKGIAAGVAAAAVLSLVGQPVLAQDAAKGAALMAEARKALGGEDKIAAIKRLQANGEFRRAQGNQTAEGDFELMIEAPDKYLLKEESGNAGGPISERTQALNGTEVWDDNATAGPGGGFGGGRGFGGGGGGGRGFPGGDGGGDRGGGPPAGRPGGAPNAGGAVPGAPQGGAPAFDPERIREQQRRQRQGDLARWLLVSLMTTDAPVAWLGTAESPDGSKADVIEVKPADGQATRVFLDTVTHMPLMLTYDGPTGRQGGAGGAGGGARRGGGFGRGGDAAGAAQGGAQGGTPQAGQPAAAAPAGAAAAPAASAQGGQAAPAPGGPGAQGGRRGGGGAAAAPATIEMHLEQYKAVNGIKLPFHITRGINGQTSEELTVKSYKLNPNFKANTFTKK